MAEEVKKVEEEVKTEKESTWKKLMKVSEFKMLLYIIPVALILLLIATLLKS